MSNIEIQKLHEIVFSLKQRLSENNQLVVSLKAQVSEISASLEAQRACPEIRRLWVSRDEVKQFLNLEDTQLTTITKKYNITYSKIGSKKFYSTASIQKVLETNKKN